MRPPAGKPPGKAPPGRAPPAGKPPGKAKEAAPAKETKKGGAPAAGKGPAAPPIHWFYSWIKKEPFGDNIPAPIEKVDQGGDDSLSLDLSDIDTGRTGDPGDIFNENSKPAPPAPAALSMVEQLAAAKLKSVGSSNE
jgi:hypothetical protein